MKHTINLTIYKIKDSNLEYLKSADPKKIANLLFVSQYKTWKIIEEKKEYDDDDFLDSGNHRKIIHIQKDNKNYKAIFFKRYSTKGEEEIKVFEDLNLNKDLYAKSSSYPSLIFLFLDDENAFVATIGSSTSLIRDDVIDQEFPKKMVFQILDYIEKEVTIKNNIEFKKLSGYNFLNGISSSSKTSRETKLVEALKTRSQSIREIITDGTVKINGKKSEDMKFKLLAIDRNFKFSKSLNFFLKEGDDLHKILENFSNNYLKNAKNKTYKFIDFFTPISDIRLQNNLFELVITKKQSDTFIAVNKHIWATELNDQCKRFKIRLGSDITKFQDIESGDRISEYSKKIFEDINVFFDNGDKKTWNDFKDIKILFYKQEEKTYFKQQNFIDHFESSVNFEGNDYFFVNSKWYLIDNVLIGDIIETYAKRKFDDEIEKDYKLNLVPKIKIGDKEKKLEWFYNWYVAKENTDMILTDGLLVTGWEMADMIKFDKKNNIVKLFFVKLGKDSSSAAKLFSQVLNSKNKLNYNSKEQFIDLRKKLLNSEAHRKLNGYHCKNYYFKDEKDLDTKIQIFDNIIEEIDRVKFQYISLFVVNSKTKLSSMTKNIFLHYDDNISQELKSKEDFKNIITTWGESILETESKKIDMKEL